MRLSYAFSLLFVLLYSHPLAAQVKPHGNAKVSQALDAEILSRLKENDLQPIASAAAAEFIRLKLPREEQLDGSLCGTALVRPLLPEQLLYSTTTAIGYMEVLQTKPLPPVTNPTGNPPSPEKIALGRKLFFDPRLSRDGKISCATCHDPAKGFSNGKRFALGVGDKTGTRNVPSLFNVAYGRHFFWDGRAATLEEQALEPIQNPKEMNMPLSHLVKRLNGIAGYPRQFQKVFGGGVTAKRVALAIAAYERTIVSKDTPFDRYLRGDKKSLSPQAVRGMRLFHGQARCFVCHKGPNLSDDDFHNIGIIDGKLPPDAGRRIVTRREKDQGKFKTPTLREVARTAPYMHNGHFKTLKEVVQHYNFGGVTEEANDYRDEQLQVLYLGEDQVDDLVVFLGEGLTTRQEKAKKTEHTKTR